MKIEIITMNLCIAAPGGNLKKYATIAAISIINLLIICYYFSPNPSIFILSTTLSILFLNIHCGFLIGLIIMVIYHPFH